MSKINKLLLNVLARKLGLKQRQVYILISKTAQEMMLPRNQAAIALAADRKININKFAIPEDLAAIRQARTHQSSTPVSETISPRLTTRKPKIGMGFSDPFVDASVIAAANHNAELYPIIFVFENSVRNVVSMVMQSEFGDDWWERKISDTIKRNVLIRQSEEKQYPWHSQRGTAPIFYTDISDLRTIMNTYNKEFRKVFGKIPKVELWIEEIEKTRNVIAHNNPVTKKDRDRLAVFARDWSELAKKIFSEIC